MLVGQETSTGAYIVSLSWKTSAIEFETNLLCILV